MIRVPAAEISMGSTLAEIEAAAAMCASEPLGHRCTMQAFFNERPSHRVSVPSFLIDRTEVTWGEYARCVAVGVCRRPGFHEGTRRFERNDYPVTFVDWDDARRYCAFRGARLPREVEFERAARGPTGRTFPWGWIYNSRLSNHGRLGYFEGDPDDGYAELAPVGSFPQGDRKSVV